MPKHKVNGDISISLPVPKSCLGSGMALGDIHEGRNQNKQRDRAPSVSFVESLDKSCDASSNLREAFAVRPERADRVPVVSGRAWCPQTIFWPGEPRLRHNLG